MSWLLVGPIIVPVVAAIFLFVLRSSGTVGRWLSLVACSAHLLIAAAILIEVWNAGVIAAQLGSWPAPFGITLVADLLSAAMIVITAITGLAVSIYAIADIDRLRERLGYHAMFQILLGGVSGAFLAGDIFNLYVWFEVMLIASFGLLVLGGERQQLDGGLKYVALNLVSTILFLSAIGLLYGATGTLNMADLHGAVQEVENQALITVIAVLFIVAFGIKAAVFPLFFWLPASYHTPPVAISAIFAGLLTKVGVYALIRVFTLIFTHDVAYTHGLLLVIAAFTMLSGVLGAASQMEFRKVLSFHIVSQIGYMILGLALYTPLALVGAVFYLVHHIIVKANLFLVSGVARRLTGTESLSAGGGLYASSPLLAFLFLIPAFSLAGMPPLSGFWAKYVLIKASLDVEAYIIAAVALVTGLLTLFSMTKIWAAVFWTPASAAGAATERVGELGSANYVTLLTPICLLAALTLIIGFMPEPFLVFAERAAEQLLDPTAYVEAVLGRPDGQ